MEFAIIKTKEVSFVDEPASFDTITELEDNLSPVCNYIGFIIKESKTEIVISSSVSDDDACKFYIIPKCMIIRISRFDFNDKTCNINSIIKP